MVPVTNTVQGKKENSETANLSTTHSSSKSIPTPVSKADYKFNVVMFGIKECPAGTTRSDRMKHDLNATSTIINKLDDEIQPMSIRDCFWLGKYKANAPRPRPILIKLKQNRAMDAASILSKCNQLPDDISIKPDMTKQEQQIEAILLKERWSISQQRKTSKLGL